MFDGLLFDQRVSSTNTTTVGELLQSNHRVIIYTSPFNFTDASPYALNGCTIDNQLVNGVNELPSMVQQLEQQFITASATRASDKAANALYLLSMANGWPSEQLALGLMIEYLPSLAPDIIPLCLNVCSVANMTQCPLHLMDGGLLGNYYQQELLDLSITGKYDLPGAIYIDAVDVNGTIRTGPKLYGPFYGGISATTNDPHDTARYAYVDTLLYATVRRLCGETGAPAYRGGWMIDATVRDNVCAGYESVLKHQRARYPTQRWVDYSTGRTLNYLLPQ